jgi:hypothetical protein
MRLDSTRGRTCARAFTLVMFALLPGCGSVESPSAPEAVATPSGPPSGAPGPTRPSPDVDANPHPNEPGGFSRIAELSASELLPDRGVTCTGFGVVAGCWYRFTGALDLAADSTAPYSPSAVLRYTWPEGLPVGSSAGVFGGWSAAAAGEGTQDQYAQVYESGWIKLVGTTFEAPDAGMKLLGYWGVGQGDDPNQVANQVYSMISGGTRSAFTLDIRQQGPVSRSMTQNVDAAPRMVTGRWLHYEILMVLNTVDRADGRLKVWIDGTLTHDYGDVRWRTPGAPTGFYGRRWDPVWGGLGSPPAKTRDDHMLIDHLYLSGAR